MSSLKWSLVAGLASALVTAGVFYFNVGRERQEIAALRTANEKLRAESLARSDARKSAVKSVVDSSIQATARHGRHLNVEFPYSTIRGEERRNGLRATGFDRPRRTARIRSCSPPTPHMIFFAPRGSRSSRPQIPPP